LVSLENKRSWFIWQESTGIWRWHRRNRSSRL